MAINFFTEDIKFRVKPQYKYQKWIRYCIKSSGYKVGDINIIFTSDNYLVSINKQYLKRSYFTDIITFDYVEEDILSGDIFISVDRAKENALKFQTPVITEIKRLIAHGILHLCGFNDSTHKEVELMHFMEDYLIDLFKKFK